MEKTHIESAWKNRLEDLAVLYGPSDEDTQRRWLASNGRNTGDLQEEIDTCQSEYGLSFDYIEPDGREPGYFRYLLSTGQEEIRFYASPMIGGQMHMTTASFVLLDWKTRDQPAQLDITDDETTRAIWDVLLDLLDVQYCSWISSHP